MVFSNLTDSLILCVADVLSLIQPTSHLLGSPAQKYVFPICEYSNETHQSKQQSLFPHPSL